MGYVALSNVPTSFIVTRTRHRTAKRRLGTTGIVCLALLLLAPMTARTQDTASGSWWQSLQDKKGHVTGNLNERFTLDEGDQTATPPGSEPPPSTETTEGPNGSGPVAGMPQGPAGPDAVNPADAKTADYINEWIRVAEPPPNATEGANFRYTFRGNMVGTTADGGIITSPHETGVFDPVFLWVNRRALDSVNHCTMEEYVLARLSDKPINHCQGRYKVPPRFKLADYTGQLIDKAKRALAEKKLKVKVVKGKPAPSGRQENTVAAQVPKSGTRVRRDQLVTLTVYRAYEVPQNERKNIEQAIAYCHFEEAQRRIDGIDTEKARQPYSRSYDEAVKRDETTKSLIIRADDFLRNCAFDAARADLNRAAGTTRCEKRRSRIRESREKIEAAKRREKKAKELIAQAHQQYTSCRYDNALKLLGQAREHTRCDRHLTNIEEARQKATSRSTREQRTKELFAEANDLFKSCDFDEALNRLHAARQNTQCRRYTTKIVSVAPKIEAAAAREELTKSLFAEADQLFRQGKFRAALSKLTEARTNTRCERYVSKIKSAIAKTKEKSRDSPVASGSTSTGTDLPSQPRDTTVPADRDHWVLTKTLINPKNDPLEFTVGITPDYYSPQFNGSYNKYVVNESHIVNRYYWVDRGTQVADVELRADFKKPPAVLVPGQKITLKGRVSGHGTITSGAIGIIFEYRVAGVGLKGQTQARTGSNAKPLFKSDIINPHFVVPKVRKKGELTVTAFLWNCGACNVTWVYRGSRGAAPGTQQDMPPAATRQDTSYFIGQWAVDPKACRGVPLAKAKPTPGSMAEAIGGAVERAIRSARYRFDESGDAYIAEPGKGYKKMGRWFAENNEFGFIIKGKKEAAKIIARHNRRFVALDVTQNQKVTFYRCNSATGREAGTPSRERRSGSLKAFLVAKAKSTRSARPGGAEYDRASVSKYLDPAKTRWIAWNATPTVSRKDGRSADLMLWGGGGFGSDDFIRLTITAPDGRTTSIDMDKNDALGAHASSNPMNIIFGAKRTAPNALRIDAFGSTAGRRVFFDEDGAFNRLFTKAGTYQFDFSFRNAFGSDAGHSDIYLLIKE